MSRIELHQDLNAIHALLVRYCFALDRSEFDELSHEVFAAQAVFEGGGARWEGAAAIAEGIRGVFEDFEGTAHFVGNVQSEIRGDRAKSFAYVTAWHWMRGDDESQPGRPADWVLVAAYRDDHVRTPDGWRIQHRTIESIAPSNVGFGAMPKLKL